MHHVLVNTVWRLLLAPLLALACLVALCSSPAAAVKAPRPSVGTTVTVNVGVGKLKPGLGPRAVKRLLGKPNRVVKVQMDRDRKKELIRYEYGKKYGLDVSFDYRPRSRVGHISLKHRQFRTREGFRIKQSLTRFREIYPTTPCYRVSGSPNQQLCRFEGSGRKTDVIFNGRDRAKRIDVARN